VPCPYGAAEIVSGWLDGVVVPRLGLVCPAWLLEKARNMLRQYKIEE